tara:strand:- start:5076 stop:8252 length:3177 start_codon:yes stop_codon:yes gene_type:complete
MSSKRAKRNTKNFKKLKRTQRQDLRAGGRVGKQTGGMSGPSKDQLTIPADLQEEEKKKAPTKRPPPKKRPMSAKRPKEDQRRDYDPAGDRSTQSDPSVGPGESGPNLDQLPPEVQEELTNINTGEGAKNTDSSSTTGATDKEIDLSEDKTQEIKEERAAIASGDVFTRDEDGTIDDDRFRTAATIDPETGITSEENTQQLDEDFTKAAAGTATAPTATPVTTGTATTGEQQDPITAATYDAKTIEEGDKPATVAAQFEGDPTKAELDLGDRTVSTDAAERDAEQEEAAKADTTTFEEDARSQVAEVTFRDGVEVAKTPEAEKQNRTAITGEPAPDGVEAVIENNLGYEAAQRKEVKGEAAKGAAADMVAAIADLPKDVSAAIVEDPAVVEAKMDLQPVEVQAAVAALPTEALVSSQMESLLGGLEDGNIPTWARPAVAAMNQRMAQRGLSVSTVGRDALFNAIIQSALPMAQSNAQALQTRATQNLSNQQQANIEQSRQDMQRRMSNLANQQTAESQSAQNAQAMATLQSQFNQQAVLTTEQQQQQVRLENLRNQQQEAVIRSQNQQAINAQELGNEQQMELANLQIEADRLKGNQAATNQERLAEMQVAADFLSKNAGFKQQMELANLSNDQQMRLANLSALNQASRDNLNAAQQTELANLNTTLQTNLLDAKIAENMGIAQLNVDQQRAVQNAMTVAKIDMAKFTDAQQVEIANSKFMQTMTLTDFNARQQTIMQDAATLAAMDIQEADLLTKISITNANNFLRMDLANLSNEQQANMLDSQQRQQQLLSNQSAENAASQFNATSENQMNQFMANLGQNMEQFNVSQTNAMEQFNTTETNRLAALDANNTAQADRLNAQLTSDISKFNADLESQREIWNAQNAQAVEQSNVEWRRRANMADTAAQNAVNAQNAQNAFALSTTANAQIWQELRDTAQRNFTRDLTTEERTIALINSAMQSETFMTSTASNVVNQRNNMYAYMNSLLNIETSASNQGGGTTDNQGGAYDYNEVSSIPSPPSERTGPGASQAYKNELARWEQENNITLDEYIRIMAEGR